MRKLVINKIFIIFFLAVLFWFVWKNLHPYWNGEYCSDVSVPIGFPVSFQTSFCNGIVLSQPLGFILTVDFLIAIIFSFIAGLIFKNVWSRISSRRSPLK